jgi:2-polyprenyl-6-methoxyphenol hydroxylase-like FAD-dependent oxidoreductase
MGGLRIGIVGGSIAGCTTAIAASRAGMQPKVFERSSDPLKDRGAGLGIPTATCIALRDQGYINDGFPHVPVRALEHSSRPRAEVYGRGIAGRVPTWLEALRWGHLYDRLRSLVPDEHYVQGEPVVSAGPDVAGEVELKLASGRSERFDLVVFADGYRSIGRGLICPGCRPAYQGYFIWRGTVPEREVDVEPFEEALQRVGYPGGHLFAYLLPNLDGSTERGRRELNWGMFLPASSDELADLLIDRFGERRELAMPPGHMRQNVEADLKARAETLLPDHLAQIVGVARDTYGQGIVAALPEQYHKGRMCLVGDAGAVVPPFTTSGVFKAMKNAEDLVSAIQADDLDLALQEWDAAQQRTGNGLKRLAALMGEHLIANVPDFSRFSQDDLNVWWSEIQRTLEEVMS